MNWSLFVSTFSLIFVAELPDKTAFATLLMATKGRSLALFTGVALAFVVQSIVAVSFGGLIGMLPERWVHLVAGILFLGFAYHSWFFRDKEEHEIEEKTPQFSERTKFLKTAAKSFLVIFIAEWGDLTQLATASLTAHYHEEILTIFVSATAALWCVTALAIFAGHKLRHVVHIKVLKALSTITFAIVGIYFIFTWFK